MAAIAALAALWATTPGCGDSGPPRSVVRGAVTFDGRPIKNGEIRFHPTEGTDTPPWGAVVVDGEYLCQGRGGVPVGTHRVEILAFSDAPAPPPDPDAPMLSEEDLVGNQFIPARYNTQTELSVTIEETDEPITKDFHLQK